MHRFNAFPVKNFYKGFAFRFFWWHVIADSEIFTQTCKGSRTAKTVLEEEGDGKT
jgi:hypothetical protein